MSQDDQELVETLAGVVECDVAACAVDRCWCRKQAAAIQVRFKLEPKNNLKARGERFWTPQRRATLKGHFDAGLTIKGIARQMDLTFWQVKNGLNRCNLRRHDWGPGKPRVKAA